MTLIHIPSYDATKSAKSLGITGFVQNDPAYVFNEKYFASIMLNTISY